MKAREFDDFLYATIGPEEAAAPLSVLSMLARLGLDPWVEAARLAALPRSLATLDMAKIIAGLPASSPAHQHSVALVCRLVALLPRASVPSVRPATVTSPKADLRSICLQVAVYIILAASIMGANWAMRGTQSPAHSSPAAATATTAPPP